MYTDKYREFLISVFPNIEVKIMQRCTDEDITNQETIDILR